MKKSLIMLLSMAVSLLSGVFAQTAVNIGTVPSVTGCGFTVYDDGGATGTYGPSHNYTLTIYPTAGQGRVTLQVISLDIHAYDTLFVYDGTSATGTPMAMLNNSTFNIALNTLTLMASQGNATGALTLRFKSSFFTTSFGNNHGEGFELQTSCIPACQPFQLRLDTARCSHLPTLSPADGYPYLDLCPGTEVHLAVKGIYSGSTYNQSNLTSHFNWNLATANTSGAGLDSVTHTFPAGAGGEVLVTATDTLGCPAQQAVRFRVRVSGNPISTINAPPLCVGQPLTPTVGTALNSTILIDPVEYTQPASLSVHDTIFLPDGESCPPYGLYYRSNVTFTEFAPGATLTSANDILYVRLKMEHSAIEDIKIQIFCPNGNSATILPFPNFESTYDETTIPYTPLYFRVNLGSAYRPDGGGCSAALNPIGEPWNYVWSNNTTLGYQYASDNGNLFSSSNFIGHYNPHWDTQLSPFFDTSHSYSVDSTNVAQMTQVYHPYQNFSSLVGCPLNGNWYIQVQDMLQYDNGYIVEWELALNPQLMPSAWGYNIDVDTFYFSGNGVVGGHDIVPETPGTHNITFTVIDDFGCQYDTTVQITVYPMPEFSLGEDIYVCPGTNVYLHSTPTNSNYQYTWNTGSTASGFYTSEPGTYSVTANITGDGITCSSSDTVELQNFVVSDTTFLVDSICQGYDYDNYGFTISAEFLSQDLDEQPNLTWDWFTGIQTAEDQNGCDSLVHLHLVVFRHWQKELTVFACEQYIWEGDTLTESGNYVKDYVSQHDCDSTVTLHLDIGHPEEEEFWITSCGPYVWNGETFPESGDYLRYFTSIHNCDSAVTIHLTVVDTFLRTSNSNPEFCDLHETVLGVEGSFDNFVWSNGETAPSITVTESGLYSVTASNYACERTEAIAVPFCPLNILLPNAITPSRSDGLNDALFLSEYAKNEIGDFSIAIFNRWGEQVFYSEDKNFRWDGRKDGKLMVNVVYNYLIRCTDRNGKPYVYKGSVTVL